MIVTGEQSRAVCHERRGDSAPKSTGGRESEEKRITRPEAENRAARSELHAHSVLSLPVNMPLPLCESSTDGSGHMTATLDPLASGEKRHKARRERKERKRRF